MKTDIHFHVIPQEYIDLISKPDSGLLAKTEERNEKTWIIPDQGLAYPLLPGFHDLDVQLADMAKMKLERAVLSVSPALFYYWAAPSAALETAKVLNNAIYKTVSAYPDKFIGMGTLPMQDIDLAIKELDRCVKELGFRSFQIGSNVEGIQYDDPRFLPFFQECNDLGIVLLMHPYYVVAKEVFSKYYLRNFYGFPLDGAMACVSLIFGGVFDKCPNLNIIFTHGAGFFPYLFGRLMHGYQVRTEPKANGSKAPDQYLHQMYFDSMVYGEKQLRFLVEFAGADHVLLGTDYAFDMAETAPVDFITNAGLTPDEQELILSGNLNRLLGI